VNANGLKVGEQGNRRKVLPFLTAQGSSEQLITKLKMVQMGSQWDLIPNLATNIEGYRATRKLDPHSRSKGCRAPCQGHPGA